MIELRDQAIEAVRAALNDLSAGHCDCTACAAALVDAVFALLGEPVEEFAYESHLFGGWIVVSWQDGPAEVSAVRRRMAFRSAEEKFGAGLAEFDAAELADLVRSRLPRVSGGGNQP